MALLWACSATPAVDVDPVQAALERTAAAGEEARAIYEGQNDPRDCSVVTLPMIRGEVVRVEGQAVAIATDSDWRPEEGEHLTFELYRGSHYKGRALSMEVVDGVYVCHVVHSVAGPPVAAGDKAATHL